jgi:hypothetical protein
VTGTTPSDMFSRGAGRILRDLAAALIAIACIGLVIFLAAMMTAAFFVLAGIGLLAAGAYWLWRKVRGKRKGTGPEILVATRGPEGWTVDGVGPSGR